MKNKTLATWLAFWTGPLGLHRFYLYGLTDVPAWLLPIPTALGGYGLERVQKFGQDDTLSWMLIPLLGFTIAGCALNAIVYGLTPIEKWNAKFNPQADALTPSGRTQWGTVMGIVSALLLGTTVLMASLVFSFQRYFEYQIERDHNVEYQAQIAHPVRVQRVAGAPEFVRVVADLSAALFAVQGFDGGVDVQYPRAAQCRLHAAHELGS